MKTKPTPRHAKLPTSYEALCELHLPRSIRDNVDLDNASEVVDALAVLERRTRGQEDYLETMSILIERFEDERYPIERIGTPLDRLRYLMDNRGMNASDLGRLLGERSMGSAVLSGRRELSKAHLRLLGTHFGVRPGLFL